MSSSLPTTTTSPLLTSLHTAGQTHLILGTGPLAASRALKSLAAGANPIVLSCRAPPSQLQQSETEVKDSVNETRTEVHFTLAEKVAAGEVRLLQREWRDEDLMTLGREEVGSVVDLVFGTPVKGVSSDFYTHIHALCIRNRIPLNVSDNAALSTFSLLSTHSDGPLHIGITTSGRGCKLASRLRREIASLLPPNLGPAIERLGTVRRRIWEEDHKSAATSEILDVGDDDEESTAQKHTFNKLVTPEDADYARHRRMRWLGQICEYWPLRRLAAITDADVQAILEAYVTPQSELTAPAKETATLATPTRRGAIILAGSGPGHPDLLTRATHRAILSADLILADKLVPAPVLDLIPRRTEVHIARKFPGNADRAQEELLELGLAGLKAGRTVLRLKQGDPYLYGRGAEEYHFFREHGYEAVVLPGITSALSAPLFARIPPTHRNVADRVIVCTGTGRKGAAPEIPSFLKSQTCVFLMALHRLEALVGELTRGTPGQDENKKLYPLETPCAAIERASCPDQRVIRTTLAHVCAAVEEAGSRPPGLFVVGAACEVLEAPGEQKWVIEEGFRGLEGLGRDEESLQEVLAQANANEGNGENVLSGVPNPIEKMKMAVMAS